MLSAKLSKMPKLGVFDVVRIVFGLQALEDVAKGAFLIEYVGEVLNMQEYKGDWKEYASRSQKHSSFMTLNRMEVIDVCMTGNALH